MQDGERDRQPRKKAGERRQAGRDEGATGEIGPEKMPRQPVGDERDGISCVDKMSRAEEDQAQAVERAGDAKAIAAGCKASCSRSQAVAHET